MMALTGIVFAIAFVVVQFSALAYSPRLVIMFASNPALYHTLGIFFATFTYSLVALIWTDRGGAGTVPLFSYLLVTILLIASMLAFVRLIQSVNNLQIHNVLQIIGSRGRAVIRAMFPCITDHATTVGANQTELPADLGPVTQTLSYSGEPRVIASLDINTLVRLAQSVNAVVSIECAVGETVVEDAVLLRVYGSTQKLPEPALTRAVASRHHAPSSRIRNMPFACWWISPSGRCLPQSMIRRRRCRRSIRLRTFCVGWDAGNWMPAMPVTRLVAIRVTFPMPTWEDYLALSFDEIRQFGASSVQVVRRLRSALVGLSETIAAEDRRNAVLQYLDHLNRGVGRSTFDDQDQATALLEDRQGLGLSRKRREPKPPSAGGLYSDSGDDEPVPGHPWCSRC